jgi:outer membrane protein
MRAARLLAAASLAMVASPAAQALDLTEVWRGAALHDPEFAAARAAHEAGMSRRTQAGALWRPSVQLEGGVARASSESSARGAAFSAPGLGSTGGVGFDTSVTQGTGSRIALAVRQPLVSRERDAQSRQLEIAADMSELEWLDAQQALMLRSAERYFDVALAAEQLRLVTRQQAAVDQAWVEARDRFRIGDRPVTDTHEAAARAASLRSRRLAADTDLELKHVALSDLTGLRTVDTPLYLPAAAPRSDDVGALADWLAHVSQRNPGLRMAEARLRAAEQEQRKTSTALSPSLDLVAQIGRERVSGSGDFGAASNTSSNRAIGVQLTVPLYTGGWRSARQTEARALVAKAHADLERARQQVALQTRSAWLDLAVGSSQESALAAAAVASLARLDATRVGRRAGDRTTQQLLDAENDAAAAEFALLEARVHLLTNRLRLAALGGQLDDTSLSRLDAALRAGQ